MLPTSIAICVSRLDGRAERHTGATGPCDSTSVIEALRPSRPASQPCRPWNFRISLWTQESHASRASHASCEDQKESGSGRSRNPPWYLHWAKSARPPICWGVGRSNLHTTSPNKWSTLGKQFWEHLFALYCLFAGVIACACSPTPISSTDMCILTWVSYR